MECKMNCIVPPSILGNLVCSECGAPLSVRPVRLTPDGQNICGRCNSTDDQSKLAILNYVYEAAASMYLFPCMYKPNGCPAYIPFNDTSHHEVMCSYRPYQCPVQPDCVWTGVVQQLPEHYLAEHRELCTENSSVELQLETDYFHPYLIYHQDLYFLLQIKCALSERKLWFGLVYLGNPKMVEFIKFRMQLGSNLTKTCIQMKEEVVLPHMDMYMDLGKAADIDINGVLAVLKHHVISCSWNIDIDKKYLQQQSQLAELQCLQCDNFMTPPIHICKDGHFLCADCKGFEMDCNWCKDDEKITPLIRAQFLEDLSKQFEFPCRWKGCFHKSKAIRRHEQSCIMRKYKCPFPCCTEWSGSLTSLIEHLKTSHPQCNVHVDTCPALYRSGSYDYIIAHGELFWCHFEEFGGKEGLLQIYYKGPPSLASTFRYELEIASFNEPNRVYELTRFIKNRYEVRVPIVDDDDASRTYNIKIIKRCESQINMCL